MATAKELIARYRIADIEGWMDLDELEWLIDAGREADTAIEIGTFMGRSACAIMAGQKERGGHLCCIDTFDGRGTVREEEVAARAPSWLVEQFVANMQGRGFVFTPLLRGDPGCHFSVVCDSSRDPVVAASFAPQSIALLFLDGSHEYEHVRDDIAAWAPKVRPGGLISGHDYHPSWPSVQRAVDEAFGERVTNPVGGIWTVRA